MWINVILSEPWMTWRCQFSSVHYDSRQKQCPREQVSPIEILKCILLYSAECWFCHILKRSAFLTPHAFEFQIYGKLTLNLEMQFLFFDILLIKILIRLVVNECSLSQWHPFSWYWRSAWCGINMLALTYFQYNMLNKCQNLHLHHNHVFCVLSRAPPTSVGLKPLPHTLQHGWY